MTSALDAAVLQSLMELSGISCRLVRAEEPDIENDTVEIGEDAFVEVDVDQINIWEQGDDLAFKITHQVDRYQDVIDVFSNK